MRVTVALGGNAISPAGATGSVEEMQAALSATAGRLAQAVTAGHHLVVTHGNGPQIGRILLQQAAAAPEIPPMPMDVCGAESQGQLGYLLAQALDNALRRAGAQVPVLCLVSQVLVDGRDPAFRRPSKPVGPSYDAAEAARLAAETGHVYQETGPGQWRRVVASPLPVRIVEEEPLRQVVGAGHLVVTCGGGGVPVVEARGRLHGVEAVVDKDRTAAKLAGLVEADLLLILTEVEHVVLGFGTPDATPLRDLNVTRARELLAAGEFPEGSMGPKVEAACDFVDNGGARACITSLANLMAGIDADGGTQVVA